MKAYVLLALVVAVYAITLPKGGIKHGVGNTTQPNNTVPFSPQLQFLLDRLVLGLPRSYKDVLPNKQQTNYWKTPTYLRIGAIDPYGNKLELDSQPAMEERTLTHYGLNLYDGATWEIGLALEGLSDVALIYERNVLYTSSSGANVQIGGLIDLRADNAQYQYGVKMTEGDKLPVVTLPGNVTRVLAQNGVPSNKVTHKIAGAFFYRMIGPSYAMTDPLDGNYGNAWKFPWPDHDTTTPWNQAGMIHWNDWKPITGENVWGCIIGPIQLLWIRNGTNMSNFLTFQDTPPQVQMAFSILPALMALQSPLGSLYHCANGSKLYPADPEEATNVSNENNFSSYAALRMLLQLLLAKTKGTKDPVILGAIQNVTTLKTGLEHWFAKYIFSDPYNGYRVVYQGGHVSFGGTFYPALLNETGGFAVDCQTWGMTVLGAKLVDSTYGSGTAYQVWQAVKKFAGYYDKSGQLGGVGYTSDPSHVIWSAEWSWGAIGMCKKLAYDYSQMGHNDWATELEADAKMMISLLTQPMIRCKDETSWCGGGLVQEDGSYLYANERFFIPWGWYANPIGATCSTAWAIMHQHDFCPFYLGGGYVSPYEDLA